MRYAFADPPYPGCAHYYDENTEVDYGELITALNKHYDGWALCLGSVNLFEVLPFCPSDVRIGAWVKTFAAFKPNVNPAFAWEPVIFRGIRTQRSRTEDTVRDWVSAPITLRKGLVGAKPMAFNQWIIAFLGLTDDDTLDDLFPGTEGMMAAWGASMQELLFVS